MDGLSVLQKEMHIHNTPFVLAAHVHELWTSLEARHKTIEEVKVIQETMASQLVVAKDDLRKEKDSYTKEHRIHVDKLKIMQGRVNEVIFDAFEDDYDQVELLNSSIMIPQSELYPKKMVRDGAIVGDSEDPTEVHGF